MPKFSKRKKDVMRRLGWEPFPRETRVRLNIAETWVDGREAHAIFDAVSGRTGHVAECVFEDTIATLGSKLADSGEMGWKVTIDWDPWTDQKMGDFIKSRPPSIQTHEREYGRLPVFANDPIDLFRTLWEGRPYAIDDFMTALPTGKDANHNDLSWLLRA